MSTTELATRNGSEIAPRLLRGASAQLMLTPRTLDEAERLADGFARSGMFAAKTTAQALTILMTGLELGLGPAQAMRSIDIVQNKPVIKAEAMLALVRKRTDVCKYFQLLESTDEVATYETWRVGDPVPIQMSFDTADAKAAGLLDKPTWKQYPATMRRWRCVSNLVKERYSDIILGLYTPDELGAAEEDLTSGEYERRQSASADVIDGKTGEIIESEEDRRRAHLIEQKARLDTYNACCALIRKLPTERKAEAMNRVSGTDGLKKMTLGQLETLREDLDKLSVPSDIPPDDLETDTGDAPKCMTCGKELAQERIDWLMANPNEPNECGTCQGIRLSNEGQGSLLDAEESAPTGLTDKGGKKR